jgi:dTDP-4-amino-4,6-dideoxygalactose transaminase
MYYVLLAPEINRQNVLSELKKNDIYSVFHYVPLHSSPGGQHYGRAHGELEVTDRQSERLVRLPLWVGLSPAQQDRIVEVLSNALD